MSFPLGNLFLSIGLLRQTSIELNNGAFKCHDSLLALTQRVIQSVNFVFILTALALHLSLMLTLHTGHIISAFPLKSIHVCGVLILDSSNLISTLLLEVSDLLCMSLVFRMNLVSMLGVLRLNLVGMSLITLFLLLTILLFVA